MKEFLIPEQIEDFRTFYKSQQDIQLIKVNITTGTSVTLGEVKKEFDNVAEILNPHQEINYQLEYDDSLPKDKKIIKVIV